MRVIDAIKAYDLLISGHCGEYTISEEVSLPEGAILYQFEGGGIYSSAIRHKDGTIFVLQDWQCGRPSMYNDIDGFEWCTPDGKPAVMFGGLPRIL